MAQLADVSCEELGEIVSREAWERIGDADRETLGRLLPFASGETERTAAALDAVFAMEPIRFGVAPTERVWALLRGGQLTAEAAAERERLQLAHTQHVAQHHDALVAQLRERRRTWKPPLPKPPKLEKRGKGKSEDWLVYSKESGGLVRRNQKQPGERQGRGAKAATPSAHASGYAPSPGSIDASRLSFTPPGTAAATPTGGEPPFASRLSPGGGSGVRVRRESDALNCDDEVLGFLGAEMGEAASPMLDESEYFASNFSDGGAEMDEAYMV